MHLHWAWLSCCCHQLHDSGPFRPMVSLSTKRVKHEPLFRWNMLCGSSTGSYSQETVGRNFKRAFKLLFPSFSMTQTQSNNPSQGQANLGFPRIAVWWVCSEEHTWSLSVCSLILEMHLESTQIASNKPWRNGNALQFGFLALCFVLFPPPFSAM